MPKHTHSHIYGSKMDLYCTHFSAASFFVYYISISYKVNYCSIILFKDRPIDIIYFDITLLLSVLCYIIYMR